MFLPRICAMTIPIKIEPLTFTVKVPNGKMSPNFAVIRVPSQYLPTAPIPAPKKTKMDNLNPVILKS